MAILKTLVSISALLLFFISVLSIDDDEAAYMVKLMKALTPPPHNWSNNTDICQWRGVTCGAYGHVEFINLNSMWLTGTLPSDINSLFVLTKLILTNNSLTGPLPSLANLTSLEEVHLGSNNFSSIPDGCFQGLTALKVLSLRNNTNLMPWTFPTDLTSSSLLSYLELDATNLMGSIPDVFHSFLNLFSVDLSRNNLSGVLPKSFARSNISALYLYNQTDTKLSGTIEVLSSMANLLVVYLEGNLFEGPIPDLSNCTGLLSLGLDSNQLTGVVPPSLTTLPNLQGVYLENNYLQGPMPVFDKDVITLLGNTNSNGFCLDHVGPCDQRVTTLLEIAGAFGYPILLARSWRGNDPCHDWSFIVCDGNKIRTVNLTRQNLTGTITPAFSNLTDLWELYLGGNNLKGTIPGSLTTLPQLKVLDISNNNLSGNIPRFSPKVRFTYRGNVLLGLSQANGTTPSTASGSAASTTSTPSRWIAGASTAGAGIVIIFAIAAYHHKRCLSLVHRMLLKKTRTSGDNKFEDLISGCGSLALKRYSYSEVKKMTNSFRDKLGQGGYGIVYKGSLTDGHQVAVKVLSESKGSGEDFINEVASISRTSHVNIVSLLGFSYEMKKRALIYEFMPNGSLDKFIYKNGSPNTLVDLDWNTLYQITISIARGLEYLHRGCNTRILHLDIKPQNILLDEDFCPKIADFGLAKICKKKESVVSIPGTRGTPGYIAPEVFSRTYGGVSHKSDVYSYGMLILEVVGGRKYYDNGESRTSEMYFPDWIYKDLEHGNIPARCSTDTPKDDDVIMKITLVSLWCIQPNPADRPSISKVIEMLEGPLQSLPYPPKPILYSPERPLSQFSDISYSSIYDTNSITTQENGSTK